ncbi:ferritin family protein [Streptosporangium sp. OZ121]|uniref:ferritin family protein n=1 Tax=Streptosporangium sp. OZ121 TaxID=3444183 RepID=UPI003F7B09E9
MRIQGFARWRIGAAALGTVALLATPAGGATASPGQGATASPGHGASGIDPSTRANVTAAMHGEAFAHAEYRAYAAQAARERLPDVRALFDRTAAVELGEHFAEQAELIGLVGDNAANLRAAIAGESYEATTMYRRFAAQAEADGDLEAARLFTEISGDEARHRRDFVRALKAVSDPSSGATVPGGMIVEAVSIPAGRPEVSSPRTLRNLRSAMRGEAFAHAAYTLYAERARATGRPDLAVLFDRTARVELTEHFAEEATLAGLVRGTRSNLCEAIAGETREGDRMYPSYARRAAAAGDTTAAELLTEIAHDELGHARAFTAALSALGGRCPASR